MRRANEIMKTVGAAIETALALVLFTAGIWTCLWIIREAGYDARETATVEVMAASAVEDAPHGIEIYREGEGEPPAWYDPTEPMAAEYSASYRQVTETNNEAVSAPVCEDFGVAEQVKITGWDGHTLEPWELDLFSRIVYLEFLGCSQECFEAGVDSVLRLWESEYFGKTLGETLTATAENGARVYTTYDYVWATEYDAAALAEIRALCEERFYNAPVWIAPFFQLHFYPSWAQPCYMIDGVYFSTFMEGTR